MIAAIQAAGRSLRMGEDKAWVMIDGRPMIEHVLTAAQSVVEELSIVVNDTNPKLAQYEQLAARWDALLLYDLESYRGPLVGLETALWVCPKGESTLILACDLPSVTAEFLQLLRDIHEAEESDLTVPLDAAERPQMLAAIYTETCLRQVSDMLADNELKVQLLQERVKTRRVRFAEYAYLAHSEHLLRNVNTPEDYQQIGVF